MAKEMDDSLKAKVEAALFMSNEPITLNHICKLTGRKPEAITKAMQEIKSEMERPERGMNVIETSQGFQMKVKPDYVQMVRPLTPYNDLSRGLLKVLAMVAYKQPITQSNIVKALGNRAYEYVKKLEGRGLINTVKSGRTKALVATKEFANYFGLENTEDLKKFFDKIVGGESIATGAEQPRPDVRDKGSQESG